MKRKNSRSITHGRYLIRKEEGRPDKNKIKKEKRVKRGGRGGGEKKTNVNLGSDWGSLEFLTKRWLPERRDRERIREKILER